MVLPGGGLGAMFLPLRWLPAWGALQVVRSRLVPESAPAVFLDQDQAHQGEPVAAPIEPQVLTAPLDSVALPLHAPDSGPY